LFYFKCKKCRDRGISLIDSLAYSTNEEIKCRKCGARFKVNGFIRYFYLIFESALIIISILYSFYMSNVLPLVLVIIVAIVIRARFLYVFSVCKNKRTKLRNLE